MRTTVDIPEVLLEKAKRRAGEEKTTLSDVVGAALQAHLTRPVRPDPAAPFRLVTFGAGGLQPGVSFERLKDLVEIEDAERLAVAAPTRGKRRASPRR
jgi:hypothetical protein